MPTPISTIRGTGNIVQTRRVIDIAEKIDVLEPDATPLLTLTKKMGKKSAVNPEFKWQEEESLVKTDQVNGAVLVGATSIVVDNGSRFRAGDVVRFPATGEQVLVTAVSTNTLTVTRAWGVTAAAAIADNAYAIIVGNANAEGATSRTANIGDVTIRTNYTQIFRTKFGVTGTLDASDTYGKKDLAHQRMMQLNEHQKEIERAFWFGEPKEDTSGAQPTRATGGVDYWISTNATDAGGSLTELEFDTFLRTGFRYGSKKKWLFASPIIVQALNYWAKARLQTEVGADTYGVAVMKVATAFGTVHVVLTNLFAEDTTYAGYAYLLDMESLTYRFLAGRDTKLRTNIQENSADGQEDEYLTECGLQLSHEKKNAVLYNVTSFA